MFIVCLFKAGASDVSADQFAMNYNARVSKYLSVVNGSRVACTADVFTWASE